MKPHYSNVILEETFSDCSIKNSIPAILSLLNLLCILFTALCILPIPNSVFNNLTFVA